MTSPLSRLAEAHAVRPLGTVSCFTVTGHADPGFLPRILGMVAKLGRVPLRCHADLIGPEDGGSQTLDLLVAGMNSDQRDLMAARIGEMFGVTSVLVAERVQHAA